MSRLHADLRMWVVALAAAAFLGCGHETPAPNILFILVDALRADHLHCYGYERQTSPRIDMFAGEAMLFENARSQASSTFPSMNSILTSRYPYDFFGQSDGQMGIPDDIPSLPVILRNAGYSTAAVSASPMVRASGSRFNPGGGFGAGYDIFDESGVWGDAEEVSRRVLDTVSRLRKPFFLYAHFMEPHGPYQPPAEFRRFSGAYEGKDCVQRGDPNPFESEEGTAASDMTAADIHHLQDLYDDEIAFFDMKFGELMSALEERHLLKNTMIVLTADHGEEFNEHGFVKHAHSLFDTAIHVPLIIRFPSAPAGRTDGVVQSLDIVPTLLDYAGVDARNAGLKGRSLRPLIEEEKSVNEYAFAVQGTWRSVTDGTFKMIRTSGRERKKLYRVASDPGEMMDISATETAVLARLDRALSDWMSDFSSPAGKSRLPEEAQERLRSLGYIR